MFLIAASLTFLAGCMPNFNWREVRFDEQKIAATFPGKPDSMTRTIDLAGMKLPMTMQGVRVQEISYTVAWVKLPETTAATRNAVVSAVVGAMQAGMLRNVGSADAKTSDTPIQLTDTSGKAISMIVAKKVMVSGLAAAEKTPMQMHALFAAHNGHAFQVVAVGKLEQFQKSTEVLDSAKIFLESVRFIQ
jgi:hypothetical protein